MKLMFNKKDLHGQWFHDEDETNNDWTKKKPSHSGVEWNEEKNDWEIKQPQRPELDDVTENEEEKNG